MALIPQSQKQLFSVLFWLTVAVTLITWVLRGLTILAFLPGLILWALLFLCIALGVLSQVSR